MWIRTTEPQSTLSYPKSNRTAPLRSPLARAKDRPEQATPPSGATLVPVKSNFFVNSSGASPIRVEKGFIFDR